ncbi:MAG: hypothetical protein IJ084_02755 [Prevotella sp.]|nr:hypothetical protein [Prevotella sp.]
MITKKEISKLKKLLVDELPTEDVREVEKRIVEIYAECYFIPELQRDAIFCMHRLLMDRWILMHDRLTWDETCVNAIQSMNERMKKALIEMRNKTQETYDWLAASCPRDQTLEVTGMLYVDDMKLENWRKGSRMWYCLTEVLKTPQIVGLYQSGITHPVEFSNEDDGLPQDNSELEVLYQADHQDNWNEHMDREKTDHLNIVYGVHNMIDHCHWTLQDLMGIRTYSTKIEIEYRKRD